MASDALKLEKLRLEAARESRYIDLAKEMVKNPIFELVGGFVLIEMLQRTPESRPIIGSLQGTAMEAGIAAIIAIQQLAPSIPYVADAASKMIGQLTDMTQVAKLAPLLAAA